MDEAIETLASPDVTVTNQSDKELQLYKLRELDSLVQEAVAQCAREAVEDSQSKTWGGAILNTIEIATGFDINGDGKLGGQLG